MSTSPQLTFQQAISHLQSGANEQALEGFSLLSTQYPRDATICYLTGVAQRRCGHLDEAEQALSRSLAINGQQPEAYNQLGLLYKQRTAYAQALACFDHALGLEPKHRDAMYNKGLVYNEQADWTTAEAQMRRCLRLDAKHTGAWIALGVALKGQERFDEALNAYDRALALRPNDVVAMHNKAVVLKLQGRWAEAAELLEQSAKLAPNAPEVFHNLGAARSLAGDVDGAIGAYKRALQLRPRDAQLHHWLNKLLWIHEREEFLASYFETLRHYPQDVALRIELAKQLMLAERLDEAEHVLREGLDREPPRHDLCRALGEVLHEREQFDESLAQLELADAQVPNDPQTLNQLGRTVLGMGDAQRALRIYERLLTISPFDQAFWGMKATALRVLGHPDYDWLYDYERLLFNQAIDVPPGYDDIEQFNQALLDTLMRYHGSKAHPLDQSLKYGTQTLDHLFLIKEPTIQALKQALTAQLERFIAALPRDDKHPTLSRIAKRFDYIGAWSVRLRGSGFHKNHHHADGWLSGPYYVSLPDEVKDTSNRAGYIKLGEPGFKSIEPLVPERYVQPKEGHMVVFPSYMWHGTVAFESDQPRVTVAYDIVPK